MAPTCRPVIALVASALVSACGAAPPERPRPLTVEMEPSPKPPATAPRALATSAASTASSALPPTDSTPHEDAQPQPLPTCRVEPPPLIAAPTPPGACVPVSGRIQRELRPKLAKRFSPTIPGATLALSFDCDALGGVNEIVYEVGSGHGQDLSLVRLRRKERHFEALRIQRPSMFSSARLPAVIERGDIHASFVDALLPAVRGLLLAKLEQRTPPGPTSGSSLFSSGNWHGALRLTDAAGHVVERGFTGYASSDEQLRSIPMAEVVHLLDPVVERIHWQPAPADANVRSFFVERFLSARPARAGWWVKERLVMLAEHAGTPALVPKLVALATDMGADASVERTRTHAVDALAALSGFDPRRDAFGNPVPLDAATAAYARACQR